MLQTELGPHAHNHSRLMGPAEHMSLAHAKRLCSSDDAEGCRKALLHSIFNASKLPARAPDFATPAGSSWPGVKNASAVGSPLPAHLVWTIRTPSLVLNSSVLFYRTQTQVLSKAWAHRNASASSSRGGQSGKRSTADTLVVYHHGHEPPPGCRPNTNRVAGHFTDAGYDLMELFMPLRNCNNVASRNIDLAKGRHDYFKRFDGSKDERNLRFFMEPALLAIAHAQSLRYANVVLVGLSGGGWTLLFAAGLLPKILLTVDIAGTCRDPLLANPIWKPHYEQTRLLHLLDERRMFELATRERGRTLLQIFHETDRCCCSARSLGWDQLRALDARVLSRVNGYMRTAITNETDHAVNPTDRAMVFKAIEALRRNGEIVPPMLATLPCDLLSGSSEGSNATAMAGHQQHNHGIHQDGDNGTTARTLHGGGGHHQHGGHRGHERCNVQHQKPWAVLS